MTRSGLRNPFLLGRSEENRKLFCKQRNKWVSLLRNLKRFISETKTRKTLQIINVSGKSSNPSCPKKCHFSERTNLTDEENDSWLTYWEEVPKELNNFSANAVKNLNISNYKNCDSLTENIDDHTH